MAGERDVICFHAAAWNCHPKTQTTMVVRTNWTHGFQSASGPIIARIITGIDNAAAPRKSPSCLWASASYRSVRDRRSSSGSITEMW